MFSKILIANRGEIACRIARTAKAQGICVVAVYSDADENALHVAMADEAYHIGGSTVGESYLNIERIIAAALASGAQAIHPGYGFLSENPAFVEAVEAAGLTFIGPPARAIRAMGLKDTAKALMARSGVPVVPGYHGEEQEVDFLARQAELIGYPVLIKARAGGGGKGMRKVEQADDFHEALLSAQREGLASFGDGHVLIEKYIASPRHVEVQVFADSHGNAVHLFERDCSLQRRHQKVIEEAPAPGMSFDMREIMGAAAVKAAQAVGYEGAGTVEFICDSSNGLQADKFWFMEMNTRLQVEHPVTEAITGEDLVLWQLQVAAGAPLPKRQNALQMRGHSFEARVYAEDPANNFLPAIGEIAALNLPFELARVDSGVRAGDSITPYYDPMIAKLIVHGNDRASALAKLKAALLATNIEGTTTNAAFLLRLSQQPEFVAGEMNTLLIDRQLESLTLPAKPSSLIIALAAIAELGLLQDQAGQDAKEPFASLTGWRHFGSATQHCHLQWGDALLDVTLGILAANRFTAAIGDEHVELQIIAKEGENLRVKSQGQQRTYRVSQHRMQISVACEAEHYAFTALDQLTAEDDSTEAGNSICAAMPGLVLAVQVAAGDTVQAGQTLVISEAMKMEHALKAPRDGVVASVHVAEGAQVNEGQLLLSLEEEAA
ncbi:acetyl/propionyl/methylcrotonyl-CoA carboxylase subunit alpha [Polycladidibacter stylochi]|uniref:acetyl/propionyl/methylcrotonyl-CoA carboxylase subunit alpha n=1 Tax=Polycladidibacter stylochi TaxID=1807766 RepID=UPI000834EC1A|nr:biotin carboxylase N-terminal domain-containing protein [Pseudovibrio stylochi]